MGQPRAHVALLVDFANLRQQLAGSDASQPDGHEIARALVAYAGGIGRVGVARAYADWSREPQLARSLVGTRLEAVLVPATVDGEDRSHIRLAVDAMAILLNGDEPDAFVLVTSDTSLVPLLQALRADGSEVVVVTGAAHRSAELAAEADSVVTFEDVMGGLVGEALELRPARENDGASRGEGRGGGRSRRSEERSGGYYTNMALLTEPVFDDYDWAGFVRLVDELEQRLPFVGVRYLVNKVLGPHNCGIDDPRIKRDLINEAVDEGLIEMYTVGNVHERTDPVTACRLDRQNPVVQEILGQDEDDDEDDDEGLSLEEADEYSASAS